MAVTNGPQIAISQIHVEAGGGATAQASLNDTDIRDLIGKGAAAQMAMSEWYGATASYLTFPGDNPQFGQAINDFGSGTGFGSASNGSGWNCSCNTVPGFATQEYWQARNDLIPAGTYTLNYTSVSVGNGYCRPVLFDQLNTGFSNTNTSSSGYGKTNFSPAASLISGTGSITIIADRDFYFGLEYGVSALSNNPNSGTLSVGGLEVV